MCNSDVSSDDAFLVNRRACYVSACYVSVVVRMVDFVLDTILGVGGVGQVTFIRIGVGSKIKVERSLKLQICINVLHVERGRPQRARDPSGFTGGIHITAVFWNSVERESVVIKVIDFQAGCGGPAVMNEHMHSGTNGN